MNKQAKNNLLTIIGFILVVSLIYGVVIVSATWYSVNDVANSFEPTSPANASTVPNHYTNLNVTVNTTGNLDIKIFANSNSSRLNLEDSLVYHTLNATENISYSLTTIPIQHDDEGLVALYHFDNLSEYGENDTHVYDFAGVGGVNNGTTNATWNESGKLGGAFEFDGVDDFINVSDSISLNSNMPLNSTFSIWIKPIGRGEGGYGRIFNKGAWDEGSLDIYINDDDDAIKFVFYNQTNDVSATSTIQNCYVMNQWNHIAFTLNDTKFIPYCNGIGQTSTDWGGGTYNNSGYLTIGGKELTDNNFNGTIDEVAIYNISLNSTEIKNIYELGKIKKYYWKVNATDTSGNSNESNVWEFTTTNPTITANFSSSIGDIRDYFYGVNTHGIWGSNTSWIDIDSNGAYDTVSNYTWHREQLLNANINYLRADMTLNAKAQSDGSFDTTDLSNFDNINVQKGLVSWAKTSNTKILFIASYMPDWLKNDTEGWCASDETRCPPSNYTRWGELVVDFLQAVNCDENTCEVEVWNEPDLLQFWMPDVVNTNINRSLEYNKLYNATYDAVKEEYPNMQIGGPSTTGTDADTNLIMLNWMSNFTDKIDFISHHDYLGQGSFTDYDLAVRNDYDWIFGNISSIGVDTSRIILDEYNVLSADTKVNSTDEWGMQLALVYSGTLNTYPKNITLIQYQWAEFLNYTEGSASYGEYPQRWTMIAEPQLENEYYRSYNVTKSFATYHSAGSTVYTSSSDNNDVKVVSSKYGDDYYVTIINTDSEQVNVTLELENYPYSTIKDMQIGTIYTINSPAEIGLMDGYEVLYLGYDATAPTITIDSPEDKTYANPVWFNVTLDEEGSWCGYSLDGSSNISMDKQGINTQFKKQISTSEGGHSIVFSCNDTSNNFNSKSINFDIAISVSQSVGTGPSSTSTSPEPEPEVEEQEDVIGNAIQEIIDKAKEQAQKIIDEAKREAENIKEVVEDIKEGKKYTLKDYINVFKENLLFTLVGLFLVVLIVAKYIDRNKGYKDYM